MKKIYLTVDDGPSCFMKEKIEFLCKKEIPALWYCRGEYIDNSTIFHLVHAIKNNFIIANHSFSHPYFSTITLDQAKREILRTEQLIEKAHFLSGVPQQYKLFRFPFLDKGGKHEHALQEFLKQEGFQQALFENITYKYYNDANLEKGIDAPWTFDACEYALFSKKSMHKYGLFTVDDFIKRLHINSPEKGFGLLYKDSNDIVLLHDFNQTHLLFEPIMDCLRKLPVEFALPKFV